jgi:hypothetical protein
MKRPALALGAAALAALAGCGTAATASYPAATPEDSYTSAACPGVNCTAAAAEAANAVTILRQTGATPSPGLGTYAVSADGTFPGGESVSVYTYGSAAEYQDELARLATLYPMTFGTYIMLPGELAVIVVNGGGTDASGNTTWGGPTPQQVAARTDGTVKGG